MGTAVPPCVITHDQVEDAKRGLDAHARPTLSLYATVAGTENTHAELLDRARRRLHALDVPPSVAHGAMQALDGASARARTVAIFATECDVTVLELGDDVPVIHPRVGHLDARWGRPFIAPVLRALDRLARYAVIYLDAEHWRLFETFLGDIREIDSARGSRSCEVRFHRIVGQRVAEAMQRRRIEHLVVLGSSERAPALIGSLPARTRARVIVATQEHITPSTDAREVLARVRPIIDELETRTQAQLLDRIADAGVTGTVACVQAARASMLERLVVCPRAATRSPWRDVVADLASRDLPIELARREHGPRVLHEMGGMGGLLRAA